MRNIKFRAWDDLNKKWLLGYEYPNLGGFDMIGEVMMFGEYAKMLQSFSLHDLDSIKLMQYTGLKDKNGKGIYEGDIIRCVLLEIEYQTHYGDNIPNGAYTEPCGIVCKYESGVVRFRDGQFTVAADENPFSNWLLCSWPKSREDINYIFFPHYDERRSQEYSDEDFIETMNDLSKGLGISPNTINEFIDSINGIEIIGNIYEHPELVQL